MVENIQDTSADVPTEEKRKENSDSTDPKTGNVAIIERKLVSTPFMPSSVVADEILSFFTYGVKERSFPRLQEFLGDLSIIGERLELLLLTRSIMCLELDTEDMRMKIELSESPYEGEVKLSRPIMIPKPLPSDARLTLTIKLAETNSGFKGGLTGISEPFTTQVLRVALKGKTTEHSGLVNQVYFTELPKFGVNPKLSEVQLDSLNSVFIKNRQHIKALTLIIDESVRIIIPQVVVEHPESVEHYDQLLNEAPSQINNCSVGLLADTELKEDCLIKDMELHYKDLCLGELPEKETLTHFVILGGGK